jgi:pimeloyl-ACP methyl ester carboxylesterase
MTVPPALAEEIVALPSGRDQVLLRLGEGDPLLFLHGAGGLEPDDPFVLALARSHSVIAPIAPGFVDSADLDDIEDVHDLAMHYDDLLDALGLDSVAVVGHSFGGMAAAELAAHHPRRVRRLALIAPVGLWNDDDPVADVFAATPQELPAMLWSDPMHPGAQRMAPGDGPPDPAVLIPALRGMAAVAKLLWPIPERGLARRLRRISAPTLLLWGEDDAVVPASYADRFAAAMPDARKVILPGGGHMVAVERLDEAVGHVTSFLVGQE